MSTKNKKRISYCAVILSSWVNGSLAVTHDPLTHFHLWSTVRIRVCCGRLDAVSTVTIVKVKVEHML